MASACWREKKNKMVCPFCVAGAFVIIMSTEHENDFPSGGELNVRLSERGEHRNDFAMFLILKAM